MIKATNSREPVLRYCLRLSIVGACAALIACQPNDESWSSDLSVESLTVATSLSAESEKLERRSIKVDGPQIYRFDSSGDLARDSETWLFRRVPFIYSADHGYLAPGSIFVKNRRESWQGPLVRLSRFEAGSAYQAAVWVKLVNASSATPVSLVLTRVTNGASTNFTLGQTSVEPNGWHKVEGEFIAVPEGPDDITTLHLDVPDIAANYYMDDLTLSLSDLASEVETAGIPSVVATEANHIRNGDVESGLDYWTHQGGVISRSSVQAHAGKYSLLISGRTQDWNAPVVPLYGLQDNVRYQFRIFARLTEGQPSADVKLTLRRVTEGQTTFIPIKQVTASDSEWTEVRGNFSATNISQSETVSIYLECLDPSASYYVDSLTVRELR